MNLHELTIKQASDALSRKEFSSTELFEACSIEDMKRYSPRINERHLVLLSCFTIAESRNDAGFLELILQDGSGSIEAHVNSKNALDMRTYESARGLSAGSSLTSIGLYGPGEIRLPGKVNDSLVALPLNRVGAEPGKFSVVYVPPVMVRQNALRPCTAMTA